MNYIMLHYVRLPYIKLHYITLHYIALHYITLHYSSQALSKYIRTAVYKNFAYILFGKALCDCLLERH
jgi:hypothetical protein